MEYIPLYARGGAVIPTWPDAPATTMDHHPAVIELHVFVPDADGETRSVLHEDDGNTFAFRDGAFYRTVFVLQRKGSRVTLDATVTGGGYPDFRRERFVFHFHGLAGEAVIVDGVRHEVHDRRLTLENAGTGILARMQKL